MIFTDDEKKNNILKLLINVSYLYKDLFSHFLDLFVFTQIFDMILSKSTISKTTNLFEQMFLFLFYHTFIT